MALTETRPETETTSVDEPTSMRTLDGLIGSSDHKTVGRGWIGLGLVVLVVATIVSAIAGFEAADLGGYSLVKDGEEFTQIWSLGRELFLFGAIVPILIGLATFVVPLQIGAPAIAFARGAAGALWTWLLGLGLLIAAYLLNGGPGGGQSDFVVLWAVALGMMIIALLWAMLILATTILGARAQGMTLERVPSTTWSFLVFSLFGLLTLPILLVELVLIYVQVRHGFLPLGSRQSLTGVMDSVSLAPAVYWVGIPLLGMAVDMVGVHTSRPVRAHKPVMVALGTLGVLAYGADFFGLASVRVIDFNHELLALAIAAAIIPVLAVLGLSADSVRNGTVAFTTPMIGSLVAGSLLLLAAVVSLLGLAEPLALFLAEDLDVSIDLDKILVLNGTTFHDGIRGLVLGATIVAIVAALHHWSAKIWGRRLKKPLGLLSVLAVSAGAVLWGLGAVLAGIDDQPAYPESTLLGGGNVEVFNLIAAIGMVLVAFGAIAALIDAAGAAMSSNDSSGPEAWSGLTLEWADDGAAADESATSSEGSR